MAEEVDRLAIIEQRLRENPNDVEALIERSSFGMDTEFDDDSWNAIERALELEPNNVDAMFWKAENWLYNFGFCEERIEPVLMKALSIDPTRADCYIVLSEVIESSFTPDYARKILCLEKAVELEPTWPLPRMRLVSALIRKAKSFERAEALAKEGLEIAKGLVSIVPKTPMEKYYEDSVTGRFFELVSAQQHFIDLLNTLERARSDDAEDSFIEAFEKNDGKSDRASDLVRAGILYLGPFRQADKALKPLQRAVELDSNNGDALFWLAKTLFEDHGEVDKAKAILERAVSLTPCRADCLTLLADVSYLKDRNPHTAISLLHKAIQAEPSWVRPRLKLGLALLDAKNPDEAVIQFDAALEALKNCPTKVWSNPTEEYFDGIITGRSIHPAALKAATQLRQNAHNPHFLLVSLRDLKYLCNLLLRYVEEHWSQEIAIVGMNKYWTIRYQYRYSPELVSNPSTKSQFPLANLFYREELGGDLIWVRELLEKRSTSVRGLLCPDSIFERLYDALSGSVAIKPGSAKEPIVVKIRDLRQACKLKFAKLEQYGIDAIGFDSLKVNIYRDLSGNEIFDDTNYHSKPSLEQAKFKELFGKIQLRSAVDEWLELQKLLTTKTQPTLNHLRLLAKTIILATSNLSLW